MRKPVFWSILHRLTQCAGFFYITLAGAFAAELQVPLISSPRRAFPLMHESQAWSNSQYQGMHLFLTRRLPESYRIPGIWTWDILSTYLPFGSSWLHEEWHRSILSQHGISSFNEVYEFKFFSSSIKVKNIQDASLAKLKREHPADFVRLSSAGIEANWEQNTSLESQSFFNGSSLYQLPIYWLNTAHNLLYLATCATGLSNSTTRDAEEDEGTDIAARDFTGLDCVAWTYDLWRPTEAYAARGVHPSGVGVRRYRRLSDLTDDERRYLQLHSALSLLNLLDPNLWTNLRSPQGPSVGREFVRYHLAPFGTEASFHVQRTQSFLNELPLWWSVHLGWNHKRIWPGIQARFPSLKIPGSDRFTVALRGWLLLQPKQLLFEDAEPGLSAGGSVRTSFKAYPGAADTPSEGENLALIPWLEFFAKTPGWVPGEDLTTSQWGLRSGITLAL